MVDEAACVIRRVPVAIREWPHTRGRSILPFAAKVPIPVGDVDGLPRGACTQRHGRENAKVFLSTHGELVPSSRGRVSRFSFREKKGAPLRHVTQPRGSRFELLVRERELLLEALSFLA